MNKLLAAIRAQEAWQKKPKKPRSHLPSEKREKLKDSVIMQILKLQEMGLMVKDIAKEVSVPAQTVYNVRQRYILIDVKNGTQWYKSVGI
tara:strand:- start:21 stop:290 length:270 start_codon:yes stop_codon:yes gene_type:complete